MKIDHLVSQAGLFMALLFCSSCSPSGTSNVKTSADEIPGMVAAHNDVRANVSPAPSTALPPVTWSSSLAATAKAWAEKCQWGHSNQAGVGENIFGGTGNYSAAQVVKSWADEVAHYEYGTNRCQTGKVCGHYTQIVWRKSTQIGCAKATCQGLFGGSQPSEYWVCQYNPPGNYRGQKPY